MNVQAIFSRTIRAGHLGVGGLTILLGSVTIAGSAALAQSVPSVDECNQFADSVNRNQAIMSQFEAEIETFAENAAVAETLPEITAAASQYVTALEDVTRNLEMLTGDLESLTFADGQLTDYRDDYVTVVAGFNSALGIVSDAMSEVAMAETEQQLAASLESVAGDTSAAIAEIESLAGEESALIDNVNDYCGAE